MPTFSPHTKLDPLDRTAQAILADCAALIEQPNNHLHTTHHDLRCVAVTDLDGTLLIAANNLLVTKDVINGYRRGGAANRASDKSGGVRNGVDKGYPVADGRDGLPETFSDANAVVAVSGEYDGAVFVTGIHTYFNNYHAEMQLLQFMLDYHVRPQRRYIGVSKPCCPECTAILQAADFDFAESDTPNAHVVRNAAALFAHPHVRLADLANAFAGGVRPLPKSLGGACLAPV